MISKVFQQRSILKQHRLFSTLVLAEQFGGKLNGNIGSMLKAASQLNDTKIDILLHGDEKSIETQVQTANLYPNIQKIFIAKGDQLANPTGDVMAQIVQGLVKKNGYDKVIGCASAFGKDVIPRLGGLLDVQPISDVVGILDNGNKFVRPTYAGNAVTTITTIDKIKLLTIRATGFEKVAKLSKANTYPTENVDIGSVESKAKWLENIASATIGADLATAKYVVSGGIALKSAENFKMIYDLANAISKEECGIGASRAAVDAKFVANDLQIGQTGKIVSPDLYIAIGISGAIQHLAGMINSKVIVAINKDADAPIFKIADYGIVGDLFTIVPELTQKLQKLKQ